MNGGPSALAVAISQIPDLARRLLVDHTDDGSGRCRRCRLGAQAGHQRWPCRLHDIAVRALEIHGPV